MLNEKVTIDDAIGFLNSLVEVDADAVTRLVDARVQCNQEMADHESVQVQAYDGDENYSVGILGVLNGLFGTFDCGPAEGWGPITALFNEDGSVKEFVLTENG